MATEEGGMTAVECPDCAVAVDVCLPRSTEIVSIATVGRIRNHSVRTDAGRLREQQKSCSNGHTVSILYDW
jgi:hypothetical protein